MRCELCEDRGWVISYSDGRPNIPDGNHIEKCDDCNQFDSDQDAQHFVLCWGYPFWDQDQKNDVVLIDYPDQKPISREIKFIGMTPITDDTPVSCADGTTITLKEHFERQTI